MTGIEKTLFDNLKVRKMSIVQNDHPEYGTWGIAEKDEIGAVLRGDRGDIWQSKDTINRFYSLYQ